MANMRSIGRRRFLKDSVSALGATSLLSAEVGSQATGTRNPPSTGQGRQILSLNGEWQIEDSVAPDIIPSHFPHTVPVPGLAHLANPEFQDVDLYQSRENIWNLTRFGELPASAWNSLGKDSPGISLQKRNYFWYRRTFHSPARREVAILKINKAQFGTAVWLNRQKIGEHMGCFSAGFFNLTSAVKWSDENEILVRVGAHPGVLPKGYPAGTDFEKRKWTPGIYDDVTLLLSDNPVIETLQVAPRISTSEIIVQVSVMNHGSAPATFALQHRVRTWKDQAEVARAIGPGLQLEPGGQRTFTQSIRIPGARLWSPEDPFLYTLETSTGGDSFQTRFGMREFRFDTVTKRAILNGKVCFLRGSNITLHRFFEDAQSGPLPWDERWVRKLLVEIPKQMHWNSFRFCIGPVPDLWLDIADEAGLMIQNEFFVWTGHPSWSTEYNGRQWDVDEMIRQYKEWIRDNWNHPSVAIWDANNETLDDIFAEKIIPAVRSLDLSGRPWENSYNGPQGPNDPVEDHPYLFIRNQSTTGQPFKMTDLETMSGLSRNSVRPPQAHAMILNEYGWLWLNRDGSPTRLTTHIYENLLGAQATAEQRLALNAYLLAGLTEFWRAYRNYAGVLHFVYLTCSYPGAFTSDHFRNVQKLELDPHFKDYLGEAFKPLGVYIDFWQPSLPAGSKRRFFVMVINDSAEGCFGNLSLTLAMGDGREVLNLSQPFTVPGLGQQTYWFDATIPDEPGSYLIKAAAASNQERNAMATLSRRQVSVVNQPS
ncbi:MAG TPA: glycoside hydrolase family 2 TIM barrel-domain containing protein [Terriglobia bacterium]|nr:glycoside hydrolase family 2 TIM barrel-domain containing protein [Terriglobia bacterium]